VAQNAVKLAAELIVIQVIEPRPAASLQHHDAQAALAQLLRNDSTPRARANNHRVNMPLCHRIAFRQIRPTLQLARGILQH